MYFNEVVNWAEAHSAGNINLWKVVVHELGHAFGIHHSPDVQDIMYPTYQPNDEVNITLDTQEAIDYLYEQYRGPRQSPAFNLKEFLADLFPGKKRLWRLTERQLAKIGSALGLDVNVKYRKRRNVSTVFHALHPKKLGAPMGLFSSIRSWFDNLLLKRIIGMGVRKGLDWIVGALMAVTGYPIVTRLAQWITENEAELEAALIAGILGLITTLWSFFQKQEDVAEIKRIDIRR